MNKSPCCMADVWYYEDYILCLKCKNKFPKDNCELEIGAKFSEPEKIICPKCNGTGKVEN